LVVILVERIRRAPTNKSNCTSVLVVHERVYNNIA
jgi:hypothetical protein